MQNDFTMRHNLATHKSLFKTMLLSLLLAGCGSAEKPDDMDKRPKPQVSVVRPMLTSGSAEVSYPGEIRASNETELAFRVGGQLTDILKTPGEVVSKGEILMQLDKRDYRDNIRILEAELSGALARAKKSSRDFGRAKELFNQDVIAKSDYDLSQSVSASSEAAVQNIRAQLSLARHQLEDTMLRAPYGGRVTAQLAENHEMIRAGQIVMHMHDISMLKINTKIPENDIGRFNLEKGLKANLRLPSLKKRLFDAKLSEWSTEADKATRTYKLTFILPAPGNASVLPGMTAEIMINTIKSPEPVLTIPFSALAADQAGNSIVWLYDTTSKTVETRTVEAGRMYDDSSITVTKGLKGDELVVTEGMQYLTEGMKAEAETNPETTIKKTHHLSKE